MSAAHCWLVTTAFPKNNVADLGNDDIDSPEERRQEHRLRYARASLGIGSAVTASVRCVFFRGDPEWVMPPSEASSLGISSRHGSHCCRRITQFI
jgi:hypothetical protein